MIGAMRIDPGTRSVRVFDPDCKPDLPITFGDRELGKLDPSALDTFIIADPDACYSFEIHAYGDTITGNRPPEIKHGPFYEPMSLDYYLEPAPATIDVAKDTKSQYRTVVQRVDCAKP